MKKPSWSSNIERNSDAENFLNEFLMGQFDYKRPPSYNDLIKEEKCFRKYDPETKKQIIPQFAN